MTNNTTRINLAPITPPRAWLDPANPEIKTFITQLSMVVYQLTQWTGANPVEINEIPPTLPDDISELQTQMIDALIAWPDQTINQGDFAASIRKSCPTSNYVTIGNEYLVLSNNVTVTMNSAPSENESVWITWDKGFTLNGNGRNIVGPQGISKTYTFNKPYGGRWIDYIIEKDYWRLR